MFRRKKSSNRHASRSRPETTIFSALPIGVSVGIVLIVIAVFLAYIPCLNGRFVLDDDLLLTENPLIKAADGLNRFWLTTEAQEYYPLTYSMLWIEWRLWGINPTGYHVISIILHIVEALLIWVVLRKLSISGAFLAAMIFAVHPVNVESVAWISQLRNMLALLFFLLSILWYLKAGMPTASVGMAPEIPSPLSTLHSPLWYWLSLAAFVLAMLGKGSAAVLPVLLLGIIWWMRPLTRWDFVHTAPFFLVSALLTAVNVWFQTHGAEIVIRSANFVERLLGAGGVVWFYLYKAILPVDLAFVYSQWRIEVNNPLWWLPLAAALAVTAVLWRFRQTWARPLLFAWAFFCVALVPVMGFTDVGFMKYSLVADHYQHIAIIAVIALASAFWSLWRQCIQMKHRWAATLTAVAAAGSLTLLACQQSVNYGDAVTLYQATLEKNPDCWMAHDGLGVALARIGRLQEALEHYGQALRLKPDYADAYNNLGDALTDLGRSREAIEQIGQALELKPNYAAAHNNLGKALFETGHFQDAIAEYELAIRLKPRNPEAYNNLGNALTDLGRAREAVERLEQALRLKPDFAEAHNNLGAALVQIGRPQDALEHYGQALRLKPDYAEAHNSLGALLSKTGHLQDAVEHYRESIRLKPDYPDAYNNLGNALTDQGRISEAVEQFEHALRIKPKYADAHNNLGVVLVQMGKLAEAIEHFQQALQFKPGYINAYTNLALVYAAMHQYSQAVAAAQKALEIARSQNQTDQAKRIENWLKSYRAGLPDVPNTPAPSKSVAPTP